MLLIDWERSFPRATSMTHEKQLQCKTAKLSDIGEEARHSHRNSKPLTLNTLYLVVSAAGNFWPRDKFWVFIGFG